jgi:hypothetical protein
MDLQDIVKWVLRISWPMKVMAPQARLANIIGTAFSYNKSITELLRADVIPALVVQSMEKTMIEYTGPKAKTFYSNFSRKAEEPSSKEIHDVVVGNPRGIEGSAKAHRSSAGPKTVQPSRRTVQTAIPNVALILQNALAYKLVKQKFEQDAATSLSEVQDTTDSIAPKHLVEGSEVFKTMKHMINAASFQAANGERLLLPASLLKSIQARDRGNSISRSTKSLYNSSLVSKRRTDDAEVFAGRYLAPSSSIEKERILSRTHRLQNMNSSVGRNVSGYDETTNSSPLMQAISFQQMVFKVVSSAVPGTSLQRVKKGARRISVEGARKTLSGYQSTKRLFPLERYVTRSADMLSAVGNELADLESSPSFRRSLHGKNNSRMSSRNPRPSPLVSRVFSKVISSLSGVIERGSPSGLSFSLLPSLLHAVDYHNIMSFRPTTSGKYVQTFSRNSEMQYQRADAGAGAPDSATEQNTPDLIDSRINPLNDLFNRVAALSSSDYPTMVKNVTNALSQSIEAAYRLQAASHTSADQQSHKVEKQISSRYIMGETSSRVRGQQRLRPRQEISSDLSPELPTADSWKRHPRAVSTKKWIPPNENTSSAEHSSGGPVANLRLAYSEYIFDNMIRRNRASAHLLLVDNQRHIPRPLAQRGRRSAAISEHRMLDGSMPLPSITQLQVMLANHSARKTGSVGGAIALLSRDQIIASPNPGTPTGRRAALYKSPPLVVNSAPGHGIEPRGTNSAKSPTRSEDMEKARFGSSKPNTNTKRESSYKPLTLRELRKMMEQIFRDELKRYGL